MILRDRVEFAQLIEVCGAPRAGERRCSPIKATSTAELACPTLPICHAVIASQWAHEFLIGSIPLI